MSYQSITKRLCHQSAAQSWIPSQHHQDALRIDLLEDKSVLTLAVGDNANINASFQGGV